MPLPLPGERQRQSARERWEIVLALVVVLGLCALGCAGSASSRRAPPAVFHAARFDASAKTGPARRAGGDSRRGRTGFARPSASREVRNPSAGSEVDESAALVVRRLHVLGYRFGTDGSVPALWGYLRAAHRVIPAGEAQPGDVVLFDTRGTAPQPRCADHAGLIESVADGRITFVEARGGRVRRSFVDPAHPDLRRDGYGRIANSFLRPKAIDDPTGARYFAGDMLCAVVRLSAR